MPWVDNDYIQAMDEVPVTFDNLQATMIEARLCIAQGGCNPFSRINKISIRQELILPYLI